MITILDSAVANIAEMVGQHRPERGGALLGPPGQPLVTDFLYDPDGHVTGASYNISNSLRRRIRDLELSTSALQLKGILHSHPGFLDRPSNQDHNAFADMLVRNPTMGSFIAPIVTQSELRDSGHELALGHTGAKLSMFLALPLPGRQGVAVNPTGVRVLKLHDPMTAVAARLGASTPERPQLRLFGGDLLLTSSFVLPDGSDLIVVMPMSAMVAPTVLFTPAGGEPTTLPLRWRPGQSLDETLTVALARKRSEDAVAGVPTPTQPRRVETDQWRSETDVVRSGINARVGGLMPVSIAHKKVLLVGAGSVGSVLADQLVRSGAEHITIVDADRVAPENLSRTVYTRFDLGQLKTDALERHLNSINPAVEVQKMPGLVDEIADLLALVRQHDVVLACTDDATAQNKLNTAAYAALKPAVYIGLYRQAAGGEVIFTVPTVTKCYRCATSVRHTNPHGRPETDYTTGRLTGEVGLGADIAHVTTAAAKIALSLLQLSNLASPGAQFSVGPMSAGENFLILANEPDYWFFPSVFQGVAGQHAYQAVWMQVQGDAACPLCGEAATPEKVTLQTEPTWEEVVAALGERGPDAVVTTDSSTAHIATQIIEVTVRGQAQTEELH